jgi:hypothetical protein
MVAKDDDGTRYRFALFLTTKDEKMKQLIRIVENSGKRIMAIRSDGGGEFVNQNVKAILEAYMVLLLFTRHLQLDPK